MSTAAPLSWPPLNPSNAEALEDALVTLLEAAAQDGSLTDKWALLSAQGTPIMHPKCGAATFLFRAPSGDTDIKNVHLSLSRLTDKANFERGLMKRIATTDYWVRTIDLPPTYRGSYGFQPLSAQQLATRGHIPPPHNSCRTLPDPNAREHLFLDGKLGASIIAGTGAPPQPAWPAAPTPDALTQLHGTLIKDTLLDHAGQPLPVYLYLPEQPENDVPLLTLFDGETWFPRLQLPAALESSASKMPPIAVFGVCNSSTAQRKDRLGANHAFLDFISSVGTTWAVEMARTHGVRINRENGNILAGQSLGGLSCLYMARFFPERYCAMIAQSPSLWWTPDGASKPRDLEIPRNDWITSQFWSAPPNSTLPTLHLSVGARENTSVAKLHVLQLTLKAAGWPVELHTYDGGHDFAWWRGALFDQLHPLIDANAFRRPSHLVQS
ncbi:alpha/beta hydrolase-fold protein [Corynebacterium sp. H128]|uniref:alpha/beta hydrolase-fold protein n=1 Tax=Corynebacterium sp. H128 TaxID=3133427 RepID=UPI003099AB15